MKRVFVVLAGVLLVGCAGLDVYRAEGTESEADLCGPWSRECSNPSKRPQKAPGIPFYVKVPQWVQETKWVGDTLALQFEIRSGPPGSEVVEKIPSGGPVLLPPSEASEAALVNAINTFGLLESSSNLDRTQDLKSIVDVFRATHPTPDPKRMVSNTWRREMVVGDTVYYIRSRTPLFGSASSQFDIASDGTLAKAQSTVEDTTASTLLGIFPLTAKLEKRWDVGEAGDAEAAPTSMDKETPRLHTRDDVGTREKRIVLLVSRTPTTYTLRRNLASDPENQDCGAPPETSSSAPTSLERAASETTHVCPLTLEEARQGTNGVQLVSVTTEAKPEKSDDPMFRFSGQVVPPKTKPAD